MWKKLLILIIENIDMLRILQVIQIVVFIICVNSIQGQNVNFISDEGFTNGALSGQTNWDAQSGWSVEAATGVVTTTQWWQKAAWGQPFSLSEVGDQITFRVDLNLTGTLAATNNPLIRIGFIASSDVNANLSTMLNTVYLSSTNGGLLQLRDNTNSNPLSLGTSLTILECQGSETTDDLALLVTLTLGIDAASSTISAKLLNVTDGTSSSIGHYNGIKTDVFNASTSSIYGFFQAQSFTSGSDLTAINVKKVSMISKVDIFPKVKREIGGISTLDRSKYFNIHAGVNDVEPDFYTDYNVSQSGRQFYGPGGFNVLDTISPGAVGTGTVGTYPESSPENNTTLREVRRYVATDHPYHVYEEGLDPVAFADWAVEYYKNFATTDSRPEYYEPMNEPFVHARDYYDEPDFDTDAEARVKLEMAQFFKHVAQKIHAAPELDNMKILGYSSAFPSFEITDFSNWNQNMKMFMDEAGADVDIFSTHLYDGINQVGQETRRSGSNMEAILDLIETYSYDKWGLIKPHGITEFGGIVNGDYTDINNVQSIRSQNSILFGLLERTDRMEIAIPFTTGKSTWHIKQDTIEMPYHMPYKAILYKPIPIGVPLDQVTGWEYTNRIHFYELWKDVAGERVLIRSGNKDVLAQAFANNDKLYVAFNNLDDFDQSVNLKLHGNLPEISNVVIKSLIVNPGVDAVYTTQSFTELQESYTLKKNETVVIEYTFSESLVFDKTIESVNYYSNNHLQEIQANTPIVYNFNGVTLGNSGYAKLSMSIGRTHDKSKSPTVLFNNISIPVPINWKGYDQASRATFFGTIEISVPIGLLNENNTVSITFADTGGHLSSLILNAETSDANVLSDITWDGSDSSEWAAAANWDINTVPSATDNVIIPDVATAPIIGATTGAEINNLTIKEPDGINITAGGSLIVNGSSSGNITYNRTLDTDNWYLVSSPVVGEMYDDAYVTDNGIDLGADSNRGIASYITSDDTWDYMQAGETATFLAGIGYSIKRSSVGDVSFTGTLNVADTGVDVVLDATGNRYNLLGNPYSSHIASATFLTNEAAVSETQTLWVWNQVTGASGAYEVKTLADAMVIAPAQGFFIKANAAGGTFNFAESNQAGSGGTFQRTEARPEMHLTLSNQSDVREAKIYYIENMTTGFDVGYEGELFNGVANPLDIYTHLVADSEGKNYQVQSLPDNDFEDTIIPLGINAISGSSISIEASKNNFPEGMNIYLEDKQDNSFTLLESDVNFNTTLENDLSGIGRFYLHTTSSTMSTNDLATNNNLSIYSYNRETLRVVGIQKGVANISIYNLLGQKVLSSSFQGNGVNDISLPSIINGIYIAKITSENRTTNRKIILE